MSGASTEVWPWLALAGLGLFHGLNPAMGWLFAVALGLHRGNRRTVLLSLVPITVGHAAAVAAALIAVLALGLVIDHTALLRWRGSCSSAGRPGMRSMVISGACGSGCRPAY